jgi:hypothetical protein
VCIERLGDDDPHCRKLHMAGRGNVKRDTRSFDEVRYVLIG